MKKDSGNKLIDFLMAHAESKSVSFHMPGHKGSGIYDEFGYEDLISGLVDLDVTEIPGADNLFQPETVIKSIMDRYKEYYEVQESFLSIGGSSSGLIASILAASDKALSGSGEIAIARNCHKAVYNGAMLANLKPVYVQPSILDLGGGIVGGISAEAVQTVLENECRNPVAVVVTSPNYYGVMSDIRAIADICHEHGTILIVDQAHGAHLKMFSKYSHMSNQGETLLPAEECGADIVVSSTHKTLASFTQTAIVNVCSNRVDIDSLADKLQMIESSSPSYILMASLEMNIDILEKHGDLLTERWADNLEYFYREAATIPNLKVVEKSACKELFDYTKILLDMSEINISGKELFDAVLNRGIVPELWDKNIVMAMSGIGNTREDYERLLMALREIRAEHSEESSSERGSGLPSQNENYEDHESDSRNKNQVESDFDNQAEAALKNKIEEALKKHVGTVAKRAIIPYPPGVPLIAVGETITEEQLREAIRLHALGHKVLGLKSLLG